MQNGDGRHEVHIARLSPEEIAEHFDRWYSKAKQHPAVPVINDRGMMLIAYMSGLRFGLEMVTQQDLEPAMLELMASVTLFDSMNERKEGGE